MMFTLAYKIEFSVKYFNDEGKNEAKRSGTQRWKTRCQFLEIPVNTIEKQGSQTANQKIGRIWKKSLRA